MQLHICCYHFEESAQLDRPQIVLLAPAQIKHQLHESTRIITVHIYWIKVFHILSAACQKFISENNVRSSRQKGSCDLSAECLHMISDP